MMQPNDKSAIKKDDKKPLEPLMDAKGEYVISLDEITKQPKCDVKSVVVVPHSNEARQLLSSKPGLAEKETLKSNVLTSDL
jgi:hypothetical protein